MKSFTKTISIRWSDLDPNYHVRHSAYYDYGAQQRIELFEHFGLNMDVLKSLQTGPVIFREECIFRREVRHADIITISVSVTKMKPDASRWSIQHELKNESGILCATINLDGAWMDTELRKLKSPLPQIAVEAMLAFPKGEGFVWI